MPTGRISSMCRGSTRRESSRAALEDGLRHGFESVRAVHLAELEARDEILDVVFSKASALIGSLRSSPVPPVACVASFPITPAGRRARPETDGPHDLHAYISPRPSPATSQRCPQPRHATTTASRTPSDSFRGRGSTITSRLCSRACDSEIRRRPSPDMSADSPRTSYLLRSIGPHYAATSSIRKRRTPAGTCHSTTSPIRYPSTAVPTGASTEIIPRSTSASCG